ncbi:pyridoxal-dependent decarboxylase, pyridoxal binding domain-containing protein [Phthorimaea operculella]|nr:pyridoxal-dependent decarboxylase, pyridoxal binding domain-containing protein [Phthorimaea operculella]
MIEGLQKEPFYLFSMDEVNNRIQHFKEMMPRVKIFYAVKANDWDLILKLSACQGVGFDCASPGEINKIINLGVSPTSIIYAIPTKTQEQMIFAREAGVKHTTFDSSYELKKIKQYWPEANLLLRIRVDGECIYKLGEKFGCDYETEGIELLDEAASLGLKVVGVAFHVGSGCSSSDAHATGLQRARVLFDHEARAGRQMKIVDIGGGFMSGKTEDIDEVSVQINEALEKYFPDPSVQVIAEPGRYLVDSSATLYNSIMNIRRIEKDGKTVNMIYVNDGHHGTLRYLERWHTVEKLQRGNNNKNSLNIEDAAIQEETILWGPTCDSTDRMFKNTTVHLPRCSPFDWLVFRIQGAYSYGFQGPFSSIPIPKMRAVVSLELWNEIKDCTVFNSSDFLLNQDISTPLPSTIPTVPKGHVKEDLKTPMLLES